MILSRRAALGATAAAVALAACRATPTTGAGASDLAGILDEIATDILRLSPETATQLAVSEAQAGGPYMSRLADVSRQGLAQQVEVARSGVAALEAVKVEGLSEADRVSHAVVRATLADGLAGAAFGYGSYGLGAPTPYVVTQIGGAYTGIPDFLDSQHPVRARQDAEDYLARLSAYARVLDQESARIAEDAEAGVIPPDFVIDGAVRQLQAFASLKPSETVLVSSLAKRLAEVGDVDAGGRTDLAGRAETIVRDEVLPAYGRQVDALAAIRPRAVHDAGVWRLPQGEAYYAAALKAWTTTTLSPDEIHQMGVDLLGKLTGEMDAILKGLGLTRGSVAERVQALSKDPRQVYPNTDAGRAQLIADLNAQVAAITARMPEQFGVLGKAQVDVKRVPSYIEAGAPGGYYQSAALDGSRPGAYYINLRDTAEWPRFTLPTLTYHEAVPGHHWQNSIAQEAEGLPFIRSALIWLSGYGEGWALYAEQLADEMGVYADDPAGRLGYLQSMAFRASRLVVDTGIHHKRWTREEAIQSMAGATGDQVSAVTTEVERYCVWPGQACAYMVGREVINRLRTDAQTKLAAAYDQKAFHDLLLRNGAMPLTVMEEVVGAWVKAGSA